MSTFTLYLASYSALALAAESWYGCRAHVCFVSGAVCVNACVRARARAHLRARVWLRVHLFRSIRKSAPHLPQLFDNLRVAQFGLRHFHLHRTSSAQHSTSAA